MPYLVREDGSMSEYFGLSTQIVKTGDRLSIVFDVPDKPTVEMVMTYHEAQHFKSVLADLDVCFDQMSQNG